MDKVTPVKLSYNLYEPKSGADTSLSPVILLHGLTGRKEVWDIHDPQKLADLSKRKIYAIDARNHGESEYTNSFSFDMNQVDLFHFMETHDIEKAILIGSSMGGITSIRAALAKPEKVEKLLTIDMGVKRLSKEVLKFVAGFVTLMSTAIESIPKGSDDKKVLEHILGFIRSKVPPEVKALLPEESFAKVAHLLLHRDSNGDFAVSYNRPVVMEAIKNPDTLQTDPVGTYGGKALFLYGDKSVFNVKHEENDIKKHFPNAELMEFEGAGHLLNVECPEKFFEVLLNFISNK